MIEELDGFRFGSFFGNIYLKFLVQIDAEKNYDDYKSGKIFLQNF